MNASAITMHYEVSARRDARWWALLAFGVAPSFMLEGADPERCVKLGNECASWLVSILQWIGAALAVFAATCLLLNPRRGSSICPRTGNLIWWQKRYGSGGGREGRLHPSNIGRIRIVAGSEGEDVRLYNMDGVRQVFFDGDVIPKPHHQWATSLAEQWPHIRVETK